MPDIFFLILKIIGIVLLAVLVLALLLIIIVLFVPIRYQINVSVDKEKTDKIEARAKITWLLHLLNANAAYPSEDIIKVRIAFFTIYPRKEKDDTHWTKKDDDTEEKPENEKPQDLGQMAALDGTLTDDIKEFTGVSKDTVANEDPIQTDTATDMSAKESTGLRDASEDTYAKENKASGNASEDRNAKENTDQMTSEPEADASYEEEPKGEKRNIFSTLYYKSKEIVNKIKDTIRDIIDKILNVKENAAYYLNVINSNTFHHSLSLCEKELFKIFKKLKPRSIKGYIQFGAKEPSTTAQVFGIYTVLKPALGKKFLFYPSLQEEILDGEVFLKGRLSLVTLLVTGIRIYFNKDIKRTIKLLKKES